MTDPKMPSTPKPLTPEEQKILADTTKTLDKGTKYFGYSLGLFISLGFAVYCFFKSGDPENEQTKNRWRGGLGFSTLLSLTFIALIILTNQDIV